MPVASNVRIADMHCCIHFAYFPKKDNWHIIMYVLKKFLKLYAFSINLQYRYMYDTQSNRKALLQSLTAAFCQRLLQILPQNQILEQFPMTDQGINADPTGRHIHLERLYYMQYHFCRHERIFLFKFKII